MKKFLVGIMLLAVSASAQEIPPIGTTVASDIEVIQKSDILTTTYRDVYQDFDYFEVVQGPLNNKAYTDLCVTAIKKRLKAPATALFEPRAKTTYYQNLGVYLQGGTVDAQNSYGAFIRNKFYCYGMYSGDQKIGLIYIYSGIYQ